MKVIIQAIVLSLLASAAAVNALRSENVERRLEDGPDVLCATCEVCANEFTSPLCDVFGDAGDVADAAMDEMCADCDYVVTDPDTGGFGLCFSERATVQVLQKDNSELPVSMKGLKVGDRVLTGMNQYQTVYAFAHHLPNKPSKFYQIHSEHADRPLEVTAEHLVFLGNKGHPVAASTIQVGDVLRSDKGPSRVTKISTVQRSGIYAPLTTGGSLVVDGVLASAYIRINNEGSAASNHGLIHVTLSPYRMFCSGVASRFCETDYNNDNGMPLYVQFGLNLLRFVSDSSIFVQAVAWPIILGVTGSFWAVELLCGPAIAPLVVLLAALAYTSLQKQNNKAKGKSL